MIMEVKYVYIVTLNERNWKADFWEISVHLKETGYYKFGKQWVIYTNKNNLVFFLESNNSIELFIYLIFHNFLIITCNITPTNIWETFEI